MNSKLIYCLYLFGLLIQGRRPNFGCQNLLAKKRNSAKNVPDPNGTVMPKSLSQHELKATCFSELSD